MAASRIRWTRRALRRLDEIGAYISSEDPVAASRVVARIVTAAEGLADYSSLGRPGRIKGTRELVLVDIPYIIAYRIGDGQPEILTVMHSAQKWPLKL